MTLVQTQRERDSAPRSGALRRSLSRPLSRVAAPAIEPALFEAVSQSSPASAIDERIAAQANDFPDEIGAPVSADVLNQCAPNCALRFSFSARRNWRDWALGCLVASLALHGGILAATLLLHASAELKAGPEEAIPIEFVIAGSDADRNASQEGAQAEKIDISPPDLPELPPVDIAQELPKVDVPPPPDAPPIDIAQELPTVSPPPPPDVPAIDIPPPPATAPIDLPPPPDAPLLADLTPPVLAVAPTEPAEDTVPPVHALPKPVETPQEPPKETAVQPTPKIEQPKPAAPKPIAVKPEPKKPEPRMPEPRKGEPKKVEPRQIAARPAQEKPAPRAAPVDAPATPALQPGRGRGQAGSGESDQNRVASTRGGAAAVANYRAQVSAHLQRFKFYPEPARDRGITGRSVVTFTLSRSGQVLSASLAGSSGAALLDQAALAAVRRAAPFPPAPEGSAAAMSFSTGMNYSLR